MNVLIQWLEVLAPAIAALAAQLGMTGLKAVVGPIDRAPAWTKRLIVVSIAFGLGQLSQLVDVMLPDALQDVTLENLEAVAAAALAFAFHAGDRSKKATANVISFLALFALPTLAACQTGRGTVIVVDRSRLEVVVTPATFTGEVGDTVRFSAIAIDTISGDTIPSVFTWSSLNEQGVSIEPTTGLARLLRAGTYEVEAFVETIVSMIITRQQPDGSWREVFSEERQPHYAATGVVPPRLELQGPSCATWNTDGTPNGQGGWSIPPTCRTRRNDGEQLQLCAYLEGSSGLHFVCTDCQWGSEDPSIVSVTAGSTFCPTWDPGLPFPSSQAAVPLPFELFRRGAPAE